jgi:hypothetical protein
LSFYFASESGNRARHAAARGCSGSPIAAPLACKRTHATAATIQRLRANIQNMLQKQTHQKLELQSLGDRILCEAAHHVPVLWQRVWHVSGHSTQIHCFSLDD